MITASEVKAGSRRRLLRRQYDFRGGAAELPLRQRRCCAADTHLTDLPLIPPLKILLIAR